MKLKMSIEDAHQCIYVAKLIAELDDIPIQVAYEEIKPRGENIVYGVAIVLWRIYVRSEAEYLMKKMGKSFETIYSEDFKKTTDL